MSFTYLNLQGKLEHVDVTAEDIDRQLQRLLQANPRIIPVTGRAAALGDELVLDYAGPSYDAACRAWAERAEVACTGLSPERAARCRAIFRACSEHELHFWEMCATPRTDI